MAENLSREVVDGFGDEWERFDQSDVDVDERSRVFDAYFALFPWESISTDAHGVDVGSGSGRWAALVAERVGKLHLVEPSARAMSVARRSLGHRSNVIFHQASVSDMPIAPASLDFAYSLGVLHHVPDTLAGIRSCARILKPGAPLLLYLYYAFDNRPTWFRMIWKASDLLRRRISALPHSARYGVSSLIACFVYFPLARTAKALAARGVDVEAFPLSFYADKGFYTMRTDALDRFGTRVEHRFRKEEVEQMLRDAGCESITVSGPPYWCAIGYRARLDRTDIAP